MKKGRLIPITDETTGTAARRLVILIPGMGSSYREWTSLLDRLQREPGYTPAEAQWMSFEHGIQPWSLGSLRPAFLKDPKQPRNMETLARQLRNLIHEQWLEHQVYEDVVLIGHSLGGLIARRIYLLAAGGVPGQDESPWGKRVSRIVLFAAVNRGFNLNRLGPFLNLFATLLRLFFRRMFFFEDVLQGSVFVSNLRIDWIRHFRSLQAQASGNAQPPADALLSAPLIVQYLGDTDGIMNQEDSKDVLVFPNAHYREVADAEHSNLYRLEPKYTSDPDARYLVLREAFVAKPENMLTDSVFRPTLSTIKQVVMILHGIRASNVDAWINGLRGKIRALNRDDVRPVAPTYGYFSALRFGLPPVRKKNIPIFTDLYIEELVRNPEAEFNMIAHSNGTYMMGHSLERIRGMRFENVVLAGSALPPKFDWDSLTTPDVRNWRQVGRVLNERANHDYPIGLLCSALHGLGMGDVGPGGFDGFIGSDPNTISEVAYYEGGHSQALIPKNQDRLIDFALGGNPEKPSGLLEKPPVFGALSRAAPYLAWIIVLILLWGIAKYVFPGGVFHLDHAAKVLVVAILVWIGLDTL